MEKPLISVIVPIYNVEKYLERCVNSILEQTYQNIEVILVDDGSPDSCPKLCDDFAEKDNRVKVVHKENGGLSDARNAGMNIATGEITAFIDSDDWIDKNMFDDMYSRMTEDNSDIVSCGVNSVYDYCTWEIPLEKDDEHYLLDRTEAMKELLTDGKLKQHVWNKLYKTDIIKNIPFEKGKYHEDVFWSYQAVAAAEKVSVVKTGYYYYIQRSDSIMGAEYSEKRLDALDAMKQRCEFMKDNMPELYNQALTIYIGSCMYHMQLALNCKNTRNNKEIKTNIKDRLCYKNTGNALEGLPKKQQTWMKMFFRCPEFICKVRNKLGVGF